MRNRTALVALLALTMGVCASAVGVDEEPTLLTASDAVKLPRPTPDARIAYGGAAQQFGELRLPDGPGPHPVAIVVHGGCWLAEYDLGYISALAGALTEHGVATWSVEYRRVGDPGGGWPGTFLDAAAAADHLRELATEYPLDLGRVAVVGHSAGGHLALWLAARPRVVEREGGPGIAGENPLPIRAVVSLAGIADLADYASPEGCGAAVEGLLGGWPGDVPDRTALASPSALVPIGVPQTLIVGALDPIVPPEHVRRYAEAARQSGDGVTLIEVPAVGHFELTAPNTTAWPVVREAVLHAFGLGGDRRKPACSLQAD